MDWNGVSAIATVGAAVVAIGSAVLALITYRAQVDSVAEAHVHQLFSDFMKTNLTSDDVRRSYRMNTLRLYTLEEVFDWVHEQRRVLHTPWRWLRSAQARTDRERELDAWLETVASHLRADMLARMQGPQATCYGPEFVAFVSERAPQQDDPNGPEGE
jgi:hypothetical protein